MSDKDTSFLLYILLASVLSCTILYFLIRAAVKAGNKEVLRSNRIIANLKALELKMKGAEDHELRRAVEQVDEFDRLRKLKAEGHINESEFLRKKSEMIV